MKTKIIIPSLATLAIVLCSGCRPSDNAKIDQLSLKMDALIQNQSVICSNQADVFNHLQMLQRRFDVLPNIAMEDYYHTNEMNFLGGILELERSVATNQPLASTVPTSAASSGDILLELRTGDIAHDVFLISQRTKNAASDIDLIKSKLGIRY